MRAITLPQCVCFASAVLFAARSAAQSPAPTTLAVNYYVCSAPEDVFVVALTANARKRHPECLSWDAVKTQQLLHTETLQRTVYRKTTADPSPNITFARDILQTCYSTPEAYRLTGTTSALYRNLQKFGFIELPEPTAGALATDGNVLGFIKISTFESTAIPNMPISWRDVLSVPALSLRLLYPSSRNGGQLTEGEARTVFTNKPKFFVPASKLSAKPKATPIPLRWNAWWDTARTPGWVPLLSLEPNTSYELYLDLAGIGYSPVQVTPTPELTAWITTWLDAAPNGEMPLHAVLVPDRTYFDTPKLATADTTVHLADLKKWVHQTNTYASDPYLDFQSSQQPPPYLFARLKFMLTTGSREGRTHVAVSVWDNTRHPLQNITIPTCVAAREHAADCTTPPINEFQGFGAPRLVVSDSAPVGATMTLLDFGDELHGIFATTGENRTLTWNLRKPSEALVAEIASIASTFATTTDDDELAHLGRRMYRALFPDIDETRDPENREARQLFEAFMCRPAERGKTLAIDILTAKDGSITIPVGLLNITADNDEDAQDGFLGFNARIDTALPVVDATAPPPCVTQWTTVLPSLVSPDLHPAREAFDQRLPLWCGTAYQSFERMRAFREFMWRQEKGKVAEGVLVLSHYGIDHGVARLAFDKSDFIASNEIRRTFVSPSVALLNGCGTADVGGESFVRELNKHGFQTVIATTHSVTPTMATDYLGCFAAALGAQAQALGDVHATALNCLRVTQDEKGQQYGARALAYVLVGNPTIVICAPRH